VFIQLTIETPRVTNSRDNQITNKIPHLKKTYQKVKKKKKRKKKKNKKKKKEKKK
jgi:NACalpha-BTF3-like transcription factor